MKDHCNNSRNNKSTINFKDASFDIKNSDSERVERFRYCQYRMGTCLLRQVFFNKKSISRQINQRQNFFKTNQFETKIFKINPFKANVF